MDDELKITEEVFDTVDVYLSKNTTPRAYQRKKTELINSGMTEVEAECLDSCEVFKPYTGQKIPNENLD